MISKKKALEAVLVVSRAFLGSLSRCGQRMCMQSLCGGEPEDCQRRRHRLFVAKSPLLGVGLLLSMGMVEDEPPQRSQESLGDTAIQDARVTLDEVVSWWRCPRLLRLRNEYREGMESVLFYFWASAHNPYLTEQQWRCRLARAQLGERARVFCDDDPIDWFALHQMRVRWAEEIIHKECLNVPLGDGFDLARHLENTRRLEQTPENYHFSRHMMLEELGCRRIFCEVFSDEELSDEEREARLSRIKAMPFNPDNLLRTWSTYPALRGLCGDWMEIFTNLDEDLLAAYPDRQGDMDAQRCWMSRKIGRGEYRRDEHGEAKETFSDAVLQVMSSWHRTATRLACDPAWEPRFALGIEEVD